MALQLRHRFLYVIIEIGFISIVIILFRKLSIIYVPFAFGIKIVCQVLDLPSLHDWHLIYLVFEFRTRYVTVFIFIEFFEYCLCLRIQLFVTDFTETLLSYLCVTIPLLGWYLERSKGTESTVKPCLSFYCRFIQVLLEIPMSDLFSIVIVEVRWKAVIFFLGEVYSLWSQQRFSFFDQFIPCQSFPFLDHILPLLT